MGTRPRKDRLGKDLATGSRHYRSFVGPPEKYDLVSAMQFNLLTFLGLREEHSLLDIGCGSLRGGKLFIPYLLQGRYYGIEPEQWLIEEGIKAELSGDLVRIKQPSFSNDSNFTLSIFNRKFDYILAQSIFSHASERQIRRCLCEAKKVMKPRSIFAATFVKGEQNYGGDEWVYPGIATYRLEHIVSLANEQGFACKPVDWPHPNQQTWVVIIHPGNSNNIPDLSDITYISGMQNELSSWKEKHQRRQNELRLWKQRVSTLEGNPYVSLGLKINRFMQSVRRWKR